MALQLVVDQTRLEYANGGTRSVGIATFLVEESDAAARVISLYDTVHPKARFLPLARFVRGVIDYRPYGVAEQALVRAYYDSNPYTQQKGKVNKAILYILVQSERVKPKEDLTPSGASPAGPYPIDAYDARTTAKPGDYWKVVHGSAEQITYRCVLRLDTAVRYKDFHLNEIIKLYDTVNHAALPRIGITKAGTLRFIGMGKGVAVRIADAKPNDTLEVSYLFGYEPAGWNGTVSADGKTKSGLCVQKGTWSVYAAPTFDNSDPPAEVGTRDVLLWRPGQVTGTTPNRTLTVDVSPVGIKLWKLADFSRLHALAKW